ncbi:TPA: DUF2793 domain-containing protein [Pseudomonas aeruginosa]|uniref:DUF2793 domain-containing protein n=1 Tax=Pseudomonas aeruginosa TaxID=287 RepID=UPI002115F3E9|nr:DUF2793 domain-containing protein [Pseudomonas aeruginosa]EKV4830668.1 DUF2793 domain-containing protein [Pseudomonas aeruginosa]UUH89310.1 DUF2793 domain-containing protein [Pseudomonas aeruginosa]HBO5532589.1 DUF2793 domain-containing protein [Pseudomonas aeruginosa]HBP0396408.1 DUF2793 domain-containing protein [Pseudomonas aeruginosa]HBP0415425.1 DUF2793 domain-containing protein [Pseudomonas aeruginosa]
MTLYMGPNTGLLMNGLPGEGHYAEVTRMYRWDDFLRQPIAKGRVATLPTSGLAEGDVYIVTGSGASQNRLARWWVVGATAGTWEYLTPKLGWRVQVANETTPSGQVKTYEYSGTAWVELVGGMSDAPSDGSNYARNNGAWGKLGTAAGADINGMPFLNLMPDSGRYAGSINPLVLRFTEAFSSSFLTPWNGASIADGGKYIYDNTTNGGTAGNLNQRVQDLLVAMGRSSGSLARYGVEFYTAVLTAGPNATTGSTGADGTTRYLQMTNSSRALFIANGWCTAVLWIRAEAGSLHFMPSTAPTTDYKIWLNGASVLPGQVLTPSDGWKHVRISKKSAQGYDNGFPFLYMSLGASAAMACPAFFGGLVDPGIHVAPIATVNSQSA